MTRDLSAAAEAAIHRLMAQAAEADRVGDLERDCALLRKALTVWAGHHVPTGTVIAPDENLRRALSDVAPEHRRDMLLITVQIAMQMVTVSPAEAGSWLDFAEWALGRPSGQPANWETGSRASLRIARNRLALTTDRSIRAPFPVQPSNDEDVDPALAVPWLFEQTTKARQAYHTDGPIAALTILDAALDRFAPSASLEGEILVFCKAFRRELEARDPKQAREALQQQIAMIRSNEDWDAALAGLRLSATYSLAAGRRDLAHRDLGEAVHLAMTKQRANLLWQVYACAADVEAGFGRLSSAVLMGKLALAELCALRSRFANFDRELWELGERSAELIQRTTDLLIAAGRLDEAEEVVRVIGSDLIAVTAAIPFSAREREVAANIERRAPSGLSLRQSLDILQPMMIPTSQQDMLEIDDTAPLSFTYVDRGDALGCILAIGTQRTVVPLDLSGGEANELCFQLRQAVTDDRSLPFNLMRAVYDRLIGPVMSRVPEQLVDLAISARGGLLAMPWACLHDGDRYLVERFALTRLVGRKSQATTSLPRPASIAAFAATKVHGDLMALGAVAAWEAEQVAGTDRHGQAFIDEAFTAAAVHVSLSSRSILHFATHFIANPADPGSSALVLGEGNAMQLRDLTGLDLSRIDLVFLSACGSVAGGGTPWEQVTVDALLLGSGANAVIGTLWHVDSSAMADLVPLIFDGFREGLSKPLALARAQRQALQGRLSSKAYAHPRYFAGISITGDGICWEDWTGSRGPAA